MSSHDYCDYCQLFTASNNCSQPANHVTPVLKPDAAPEAQSGSVQMKVGFWAVFGLSVLGYRLSYISLYNRS